MREAGGLMDGLSLHYYTIPSGNWFTSKGSSTEFGTDEWFSTMKNTLYMEELIVKHSKIIDKYDPEGRVGMIIDEWGIWCDVEPGTKPGFLCPSKIRSGTHSLRGSTLTFFRNTVSA